MRIFDTRGFSFALLLVSIGLSPRIGSAGMIATEVESNNIFTTRQVIGPGYTQVQGALGPLDPTNVDFSFASFFGSGGVDFFSIPGQIPGTPYFAWTDNGDSTPDTILGTFGENGNVSTLIESSDDAGPGAPLSSALVGFVTGDGEINLGVTGYPDFGFTGAHAQSGDYDLFVTYDISGLNDVDIFQFDGLNPGSTYIAEILEAEFDSVLGLFNSGGRIQDTDDDGGVGLLSRLEIVVPPSGSINLAVSAYSDFLFNGDHSSTGSYTLDLARVVPEPSSLAIWGLGCAVFPGLRRRRTA